MMPVSARWRDAIVKSHRMVVEVFALDNGIPVAGPLNVTAGTVTLDRTAASFARLTVDLAEPLMVPNGPGDPLSPFGFELAVRRGILFEDGTSETVPLGVFPVQRSDVDSDGLVTKIDALDRSQRVRDARLMDAYTIAAGTNYGTAIQALILSVFPSVTFSFASTPFTSPALQFEAQSDPWEQAQTMAGACGMDLAFDGLGVCVMRPVPQPSADPSWTVTEGADGVLVGASLGLDRGPSFNAVVASSALPDASAIQFRTVSVDDVPSSPSYFYGRFGRKPRFFTSPLLTSQAMCDQAAATILAGSRGIAKTLNFRTWPDPSREPGDVVLVRSPRLGLDETHIIESLTVPLTASGVMSAETRAVSV